MKTGRLRFVAGVVLGLILGSGGAALADFGWTDTAKLERIATACEAILTEIKAVRADVSGLRSEILKGSPADRPAR